MYDPVGAFKDVFGGVQGVFAGLTGAAKISGGPSSEPSSQTVRSSKAPVRFILGRASTGGVLAWVQEQSGDQTSGEWIHIVYVLSEGAIAGVDEIYVDERPLSELGENATTEVIIDPTQVNAFLLANCPDWRQEQIGRGLSFVRLSFKYDAEKFPSGIPDVRFVVRGRSDIYDPRNGNSGYSANTALLILWYLRNRCGIPDDEIIFQSFASAANISDEAVVGPDGTVTPRYFAGAVIGADEKRNTVLDNLLSACAGTLIRVGGRWSLQVGAYYGPADFTINEDMVIGTVEGTTEVSNSDAINTMRGTFVDPAQAWAETDYPEVAIQDWIAADGGELAESQSFAYVTDAYLAQRLANISLRRRRSGGSLAVPLNFNGYNCRPGRAVKVDLPSLNILGEFIVTDWTMGAADACKVTLKPYEQAIFDDAVGQPYDPLGFISLPVGGLAAVTGLAWTPSGVAEVVQGVLSWTPPIQTVLSYTVTIRKGTEVVQSLKIGGEASGCNINGLTSGVYAMSVVAFGPGTRSGEASISVNVGGPPVPESCAVFASVDTITLVPANLQNSLNGGTYEYFYATNPSAPIADAVYLGQGLTFTHTGLAFAREYFYYVRAANAYGKSDFLFVPAATSSDPTQMLDVIAGQITESELGKQLTSRIDLIDMNGPGSVNDRIGTAKTELAQQISEVNNALNTTKGNLQQQITAVSADVSAARADLQQQIANVSALAGSLPYRKDKAYSVGQSALGSDGKLYQALKAVPLNTPPPNATYWTDVGQAVVTANGMAARVQTMETKVETLEGATSAQAQQISGLQSSLTTTNGNVSAAQQAAQDAATLAGGKGKVIVQSAAPAVADRLAQNLWIDTTSNANTPKRWSGTAWVAVTDKVATDAAAAAAGALALAQTKADATVVSSLTTRVSDAEGKLTSQATRMDGMQTSIDGKASSQALQQVTSRVTATEQKDAAQDQQLASQSQALTSLTDSVSKKADASTVQSLNNRVDQNGTDIAANGQALTSISTSLGDLGGENLFYNPSFERPSAADPNLAEGWRIGVSATATWSLVDSTIAPGGKAQRIDASGFIAGSGSTFIDLACRSTSYQPKVSAGQVLTVSADVKGTAGLSVQIFFQFKDSAGVTLATHGPSELVLSGVQQRATLTSKAAPAGSVATEVLLRLRSPAGSSVTAGYVEWDRAQCETGTVASGWRDNGSLQRLDIAANASATSALTGRVAQNEQGLSSQAQQITGLQTSLTTTNQNVATAQQAAAAANTLAGGKGKVIIQAAEPAVDDRLAQNLWIDTTSNANTPKRWNGSSWVAVTDKAATDAAAAAQSALNQVALKADASTVQSLSNAVNQQGSAITANGQAITGIDASLSTVGSDNMLFNPSFDRGTGAVAERWRVGYANSSYSGSLVVSTLEPSGKAQRFDVTGLVPGSGSSFVDLAPSIGDQPPVSAGQIYAASIYVRGTQGLQAQVFVQFKGASGNTLATTGPTGLMLADAWQRVAVSPATAPVGAVSVDILYRVRAPAGSSVSAGFVEWDRAQFENGDRATGWRDNGLIAAADIATNASATTALTSRVAVAESGLTSASTQLTQLKNSIGDVGGENLLYNPSFERPLATDANIADGWVARGPASAALSLVDSTLEPGAKAQRLDVSGLVAGSGSAYIDFALRSATQPKLSPGQISTVSTHVRGTPGLALQMFFQFKNAAFATIGTHGPINVVLGAAWKRASYTSQAAPADTVTTDILLRVRSDDGSNVTAGWVEFDRAQLELGASMSGWRDNGRVAAAAASSLSSAVDGLTSSVSQQGANLSSVAGRTTSLENNLATTNGNVTSAQQAAQAAATAAGAKGEVIYGATAPTADKRLTQNLWIDTTGNANTPKRWNGTTWVAVSDKVATDAATAAQSALSQVATKAEASALQSLTNRVSAAEGVNTSQSASLVDLTSSVGTIQSGLGASGLDPAPSGLWQFDTDVEGWTASGATITVATAGAMRVTATNNDPQLIRGGLSLAGSVFSVVRARITRRAGAASDWDGKLFYSTASHGWGNYYKQAVNPSLAVGQTAVVEWDMAALTAGGTDWVSSVINQLRLDLSNTSGGAFDVDWIAVGRVAPGASSRALESVTSTVTQQGATLNAESQRIEGLMTSVGAANAAIQNEATARSDADTALSQQIQTTQSSLGATNASVQQISTAQTGLNNRVNAQFSIKVAVTQAGVYALGGIGVGILNQDGVLQSVVAVLADQFAVINAAGNGYVSPFAIQGGQVFMNDAFIRDGSIINAKIANGAITSAKIGVAEIDTLRIRGNAVTVPVSANSPGNVLGAGVGQWQNLVAVGVQMDEGGFITAQYSCYQGFGSGIRKYQFQMDINGLVIAEGGGDWADGFPNLMGSIGVGPGFFVVTVKWWGENTGVGVRNHNLFAMGTKR
ncbi:phage tail tip fiber protein [Pseudomonas juntendi]|uniref:phage tail tip fiber protein n=1 Tax=Pseudomonas juntendi TaxID=2666183 RepID=UPI0036F23EBA